MLDWDAFGGEIAPSLIFTDGATTMPESGGDWLLVSDAKDDFDMFQPQFGAGANGDDATDLGEVIVEAEKDGDPYDDWWENGWPSTGGSGPGGGGVGDPGGGGGGEQPPAPADSHAGEDCATAAIKQQIDSKPTNNSAEHSAAVYRGADGRYYTTPVFDGAGGTAPVVQLIQWLLNNNVAFSQLTSLYHNHDDAHTSDNPTDVAVNRYPSHQFAANGTGDWAVADLFVNPNPALRQAAGADPAVFKLTVEDTAGVARDFAYADRDKYKNMTKEEMEAGKDLPPAEGGCGGG